MSGESEMVDEPEMLFEHREGFAELKGTHAFIQWKGTDVCMDFHCDCGAWHHIDAFFVYAVRCTCGQLWEMPHTVRPLKIEETNAPTFQCSSVAGPARFATPILTPIPTPTQRHKGAT